jgi:iron complex transport system substrate-binding protein
MVKDMNGDDVIEAGAAKNVLTVNSVATQMVLMTGGEKAAATLGQGFQYGDDSLNKKMFPNLGDLKTFTRDDATVENVAAIDPGLVVIDVPDTVTTLREAGIPTAYVSVTSPETIIQAVEIIGDALGGDAATVAADYEKYYNGVISDMSAKSKNVAEADKPHVLYLRNETKTIGEGSMPESWITTLGGINCGAELGAKGGAGSDVTTEAIIGADPDIIFCENAELLNTLTSDAQYADMKAVKNGAVYQVPLGTAVWSMGTAEAPLMLYWASQYINSDLYKGIDVDAQTTQFFKQFYGYDLSKAELDTIFHR